MTHSWDDQFPHSAGLVHLNHAGVSPWPRRTRDAVVEFADANLHRGSLDYPRWMETEALLRSQFRELINAGSADDIALVKSTSEALSFVAYGFPWRNGDTVVHPAQEFPSNRIVWESLRDRGVESRAVDLFATDDPEQALLDGCNAHTRILAVSAVQYAEGFRLNLARLAGECHGRGIYLCVDAIQQLGAIPLDVQAIGVDFLAADGHKWLLGPEGLGVFYCRPELREVLSLTQFGWHMVEAMGDFLNTEWRPAHGARRFECGSPNLTAVHALSASLALIREVGVQEISDMISGNTEYLIDYIINNKEMSLVSRTPPERRSGIVTFTVRDVSAPCLYRRLMASGILCAQRAGGIRFSPHFYTSRENIDQAMERVVRLSRNCAA